MYYAVTGGIYENENEYLREMALWRLFKHLTRRVFVHDPIPSIYETVFKNYHRIGKGPDLSE